MQELQHRGQNLFTRDDTFFGVCEGLGQDLRIPANLIRVTLAGLAFFYPVPVVATYLGLGVLVLATRFFFPDVPAEVSSVPSVTTPFSITETSDEDRLPLAA